MFRQSVVAVVVALVVWPIAFQYSQLRGGGWSWEGKRVLITGAGTGLGYEMALQLCAQNATVLFHSRRPLEAQVQACKKAGGRGFFVRSDLQEKAGIATVVGAVDEHLEGSLDVVIANHGQSAVKLFGELSEDDLDAGEQIMAVNYFSVVRLFHALIPKTRDQGSIVAIGSMAGMVGAPFRSLYGPTKWALRGLMHTLRLEYAQATNRKLFFSYVAPGYVLTDIHDSLRVGKAHRLNADKWMRADEAARKSLQGIAAGTREIRLEPLHQWMQFLDGVSLWSGWLDWLVWRAANEKLQAVSIAK